MKFSNENPNNEGVRFSAEPRRPTLKEIREKWEPYSHNPSEQSTPINWGIVYVLNDILSYLEGLESVPPVYVPEPRLGPQPESEEEAMERGRALGEIVRVAEGKLAEADETEEPKLCTTSGEPVDLVRANQTQEIGQYKGYVVLCPDERAKGFVRPYRDCYRHIVCDTVTTMSRALSETYAREPSFYSGTFCTGCNVHLPVAEFVWVADGQPVGLVGS